MTISLLEEENSDKSNNTREDMRNMFVEKFHSKRDIFQKVECIWKGHIEVSSTKNICSQKH